LTKEFFNTIHPYRSLEDRLARVGFGARRVIPTPEVERREPVQ